MISVQTQKINPNDLKVIERFKISDSPRLINRSSFNINWVRIVTIEKDFLVSDGSWDILTGKRNERNDEIYDFLSEYHLLHQT